MKTTEIKELIRKGESETLELKKSTSELKEAVISLSAMLNKHNRGELYFGITDDGRAIGQDIGKDTIRDISRAIVENIEPKIFPEITKCTLNKKTCIRVTGKGSNIPYYAFGRAYIRVGCENRLLSAKEIEEIILRKNKDRLRWDNQICAEATLEDIGPGKVKSFLKSAKLRFTDTKSALEKLGLLKDGKLLNAAVILFGKKPQSFFPNAKLRCAVFRTTDTTVPGDMKDFTGDLFTLIKNAEDYLMNHIDIGMRLEGLYRVDVPEIDRDAMREAIINAFCHRDYFEYDSVNVAIFRDRVEIRNPGLLFGGLTIERIRTEMVSERRNEVLAEIFHRVKMVEKWGRGITKILSKEPDTVFKEVGTHFIVVFKRKAVEPDGKTAPVNAPVNAPVKLTGLQERLLIMIRHDPKATLDSLAKQSGKDRSTVRRSIAKMKEICVLRRVGPDKSGYWEVVDDSAK